MRSKITDLQVIKIVKPASQETPQDWISEKHYAVGARLKTFFIGASLRKKFSGEVIQDVTLQYVTITQSVRNYEIHQFLYEEKRLVPVNHLTMAWAIHYLCSEHAKKPAMVLTEKVYTHNVFVFKSGNTIGNEVWVLEKQPTLTETFVWELFDDSRDNPVYHTKGEKIFFPIPSAL